MNSEVKMTCSVVDDEVYAIETIRLLVGEYFPNITIIWTAQSYAEAMELLDNEQPDFMFLDIEMPGKTGFDLLRDFKKRTFEVIFTTAYGQYAIQAFKYSAVDYLLKPIDIELLKDAVNRLSSNRLDNKHLRYKALESNISSDFPTKIVVTTNDSYLYLKVNELVFVEGEGSYSSIFCVDGKKYTISRSLGEMEVILNPKDFFRTHKSQIVAIEHVKSYNKIENYITLTNGIKAMLSRRKKQEFLDLMNQYY
jgi:two-component system LytT family response regulator